MDRFLLDTTSARRFGCLECRLVETSQPVSDCIQLWGSELGEAVVLRRRRQYEHLYTYVAGDLKYPKGRWFVEGCSPRCPIEPEHENGRTGSLVVEIVIFYLRILPDRL